MEKGRSAIQGTKSIFVLWLGLFLAFPAYALATVPAWVNPKEAIGPNLARFQQGKKEQFDREGRLFKILEKDWFQVRPSNYWFPREANIVRFPSGRRTIHQTPIYVIHEGPMQDKDDYNMQGLRKQVPWIKVEGVLPPVTGFASLPPEPQPRLEFWEKVGIKVQMKQ